MKTHLGVGYVKRDSKQIPFVDSTGLIMLFH